MEWWLIAMKKYADFSGRARRTEYWMFSLISSAFIILAVFLENMLGVTFEDSGIGLITLLFSLIVIIPSWSVTVRRLHDIGKSGWWILVNFLPYIGGIILFVFLVTDSQPEDNEYGVSPKVGTSQKKCPYCAENIKKEAIVCKHCGRELPLNAAIKK